MKHNSVTLRSQLGSCTEHDAWVRTNQSAMMEMMNQQTEYLCCPCWRFRGWL